LGTEDAFGDMDFKVAGTRDFVTAIQLDTKLDGIPANVLANALRQAKVARFTILDLINGVISEPAEMSENAPRIIAMTIPVDKIGEVIGPKGKVINQIQDDIGVTISVQEDGTLFISSEIGQDALDEAFAMVKDIAFPREIVAGEVYNNAVVMNVTNFGAFVSLSSQKDGLLHVSKMRSLANGRRIEKADDVLSVDDKINVKVDEIDSRGRISLSIATDKSDKLDKPEKQRRNRDWA
jgi:polyribonucleotide nucleotidyltransferase